MLQTPTSLPVPPAQAPGLSARYADRLRLVRTLLVLVLFAGLVLRLVLWPAFGERAFELGALARCLALGALRDLFAFPLFLAPLFIGLAVFRWRWLARPRLRFAFLAVVSATLLFEGLVEYFYFEEFDARFNNIAVDYLLYPGEVAGNLWQSYDVPLHLAVALGGGLLLAWIAARSLRELRFDPLPLGARARAVSLVFALEVVALGATAWMPPALGGDRVAREIEANGLVELFRAAWTADLDFTLYYRTLPEAETRTRAARVLGFPQPEDSAGFQLEKPLATRTSGPRPSQLVIVLEESLGSDFVGALGGRECAPELERHFSDGLLLTNLIANGNRTVRGLEGVLCSFVPLPGYAILRRDKSENVATVARLLREHGYRTAFFYGGSGLFDQMQSFVGANGWQELHQGSEFPDECFRTAWGVADQYVFDALLARQEQARAHAEPLFATLLTVSNHKPYEVPEDRFSSPPGTGCRDRAVRYADACLGAYLDGLRERGLASDTLVLIVGDHGGRVYGAEEIPIRSYRIPALFVTPDERWKGRRSERLCSQIDLVPTLLDLAGIGGEAPFLGASVLGLPADGGRAFVQHNRDVGLLTDDALVVLGLKDTVTYYTRPERTADAFTLVSGGAATAEMRALADDASAVFGAAYELYENRRYRLPVRAPLLGSTSRPGGNAGRPY